MKATIYYSIDGYEDNFYVSGDTVEELQSKAHAELSKRGNPENVWSKIEE